MQTNTFLLLISLSSVLVMQDPKAGQPARQAPPTPRSSPSLPPGKAEPHPFEGVYKLTGRVMAGVPDGKPSKGYLAITRRHLFLNLAAAGPDQRHPLVNAGVREWRPVNDGMRTTARLDFFSDGAGDLHFVEDGKQETRVIRAVRGGLRVMQGQRSWLEFERIE